MKWHPDTLIVAMAVWRVMKKHGHKYRPRLSTRIWKSTNRYLLLAAAIKGEGTVGR